MSEDNDESEKKAVRELLEKYFPDFLDSYLSQARKSFETTTSYYLENVRASVEDALDEKLKEKLFDKEMLNALADVIVEITFIRVMNKIALSTMPEEEREELHNLIGVYFICRGCGKKSFTRVKKFADEQRCAKCRNGKKNASKNAFFGSLLFCVHGIGHGRRTHECDSCHEGRCPYPWLLQEKAQNKEGEKE